MAFPDDLTDVAVFKIHPAIGCARLANNADFYEFFEYEEKRAAGQERSLRYMSMRDGKHWMMRQAVRFRVFAYRANGDEAGELTGEVMTDLGISATWTARVANRKLNIWSNGATPVVEAQASAAAGETKRLEGANPWHPGKAVWLGDITGQGMFVPPTGGVYRKSPDKVITPYGTHENDNGVLDTTSDGSINVALTGTGSIPVVPACVIVAPQDHSPDVGPGEINPENDENQNNLDFLYATRKLLGIPQGSNLSGAGYSMDIAMLNTLNAEYSPGMEICLQIGRRSMPDPRIAFLPRGQEHIHPHEIRPSYGTGHAKLGQLTAGLCSTWQTDLNACLNYWTSTYPAKVAYAADPTVRELARAAFASGGPRNSNPEWLNAHIDMMDVARDIKDDVFVVHGTERDANDNAGATPGAPYPLEPTFLPPTTS